MQELPLDFHREKSTGECMFKIYYDIEKAMDCIVSIPKEVVNIFAKMVFTLTIVFFLDRQMALLAVILAALLYMPAYFLSQRMRKIWERIVNNSQSIFQRMEEVFSHIYLIKALGKEKEEINRHIRALRVNAKMQLYNMRLEIVNNFSMESLNRLVIGLMAKIFG